MLICGVCVQSNVAESNRLRKCKLHIVEGNCYEKEGEERGESSGTAYVK